MSDISIQRKTGNNKCISNRDEKLNIPSSSNSEINDCKILNNPKKSFLGR